MAHGRPDASVASVLIVCGVMARGYKTGGRVKGTPNKPKPYKQLIYGCISAGVGDYFESGLFDKDLLALDAKDRILVMEKLTQYVVPKQQSQKVDVQASAEVSESLSEKLSAMAMEYESKDE